MSTYKTYINTDIDYDRDGKASILAAPLLPKHLRLGDSPNTHCGDSQWRRAYCATHGGNYGDEYEGQIALNNLIRTLEPQHIRGRLIILPALNFPAAMAGRRVSPLDGLNLNRVFPADSRRNAYAADCRLCRECRPSDGRRLP